MATTNGRVAAGLIIYRKTVLERIEYLLLQTSYGSNHWTPPKGHVDPGEEELVTAKRETLEEAGFHANQYAIHDGFKHTLTYTANGYPKIVHYWLAQLLNGSDPVMLSDEHQAYHWGCLDQTKRLSNFVDMNECFDKAESFIVACAAYTSTNS